MKVVFCLVLLLGLAVAQPEKDRNCRTRSPAEAAIATTQRAVWTPVVRKGSLTSNAFFAAAEFAGILNSQKGLPDTLPCVLTLPENRGGDTAFNVVRGGLTKDVFPGPIECSDKKGHKIVGLKDVAGEVIIVAHGNGAFPRLDLAFGPKGNLERESFTADEIANLMVEDGLPCDIEKVTLLVVKGGLAVTKQGANKRYLELYRKIQDARAMGDSSREERYQNEWAALGMRLRSPNVYENNDEIATQEIPFVVMLAMALRDRGFINVKVTGVRAEISPVMKLAPANTGPYQGLQVLVTTRDLATGKCAHEKDKSARELCIDNLMAPCDECLLGNAGSGISWNARLKQCRASLKASPKASHVASSAICGVAYKELDDKWLFSVNTASLPDNNQ